MKRPSRPQTPARPPPRVAGAPTICPASSKRRSPGASDRLCPGRINISSGEVTTADPAHPDVDDVFDDLGQIVLKKRGDVIVVPTNRMPTDAGAAAIYQL